MSKNNKNITVLLLASLSLLLITVFIANLSTKETNPQSEITNDKKELVEVSKKSYQFSHKKDNKNALLKKNISTLKKTGNLDTSISNKQTPKEYTLPESCQNSAALLDSLSWSEINEKSKSDFFLIESVDKECISDFSDNYGEIFSVSTEFCQLFGKNKKESTYNDCKYALRDIKALWVYEKTKNTPLSKLSYDELTSRATLIFSSAREIPQNEKLLINELYNRYGDREQVKMAYRQFYGIIYKDDSYKPTSIEEENLNKIQYELGLPSLKDKPLVKWNNMLNFENY